MQGEVGDPVTAPELVEVVAEALLSVELGRAFDRNEDMVAFKEDLEACRMDARAVLAALEAAGTVEWGVEMEGEVVPYVKVRNAHLFVRRVSKNVPTARVVSRLTLPWTAVE